MAEAKLKHRLTNLKWKRGVRARALALAEVRETGGVSGGAVEMEGALKIAPKGKAEKLIRVRTSRSSVPLAPFVSLLVCRKKYDTVSLILRLPWENYDLLTLLIPYRRGCGWGRKKLELAALIHM